MINVRYNKALHPTAYSSVRKLTALPAAGELSVVPSRNNWLCVILFNCDEYRLNRI